MGLKVQKSVNLSAAKCRVSWVNAAQHHYRHHLVSNAARSIAHAARLVSNARWSCGAKSKRNLKRAVNDWAVQRLGLPTAKRGLPTAGSAVMLTRAEQRLPTAGSNATKQDCVVLLHEMKFDHQDQTQACCPPMPGTRHHMFRPICGRIASLTLCSIPCS